MTDSIRDIYAALPEPDLHKIRALVRERVGLDVIAERAGLPVAVIEYAAARVRRSQRRLQKRHALSATTSVSGG